MDWLNQLKKQMSCLLFSCIFFVTAVGLSVCASATEVTPPKQEAGESAEQMANLQLQSESAVLMEASTGRIIYEKNMTEEKSPASITKIMTMLLIFEELEKGTLKPEDEVITSAHAKSMGGSQVFLEEGEVQTVDTMLKCIAVASGNDASVAMAEKIAGSEEAFVERMNQKAKELGMENTHFLDCCGLSDDDGHYTSAKDVALMSRELIVKYPQVFDYTGIWMEDIEHVTAKGTSTFTLSSTNKLLKQYEYTTGLKTGSTSKAKYCFSATAEKDGISMIAVVMAAPDYKVRFAEAKQLLEYGFDISALYTDNELGKVDDLEVVGGVEQQVSVGLNEKFSYLDTKGRDMSAVERKIVLPQSVKAPVTEGEQAGVAVYYIGEEELGRNNIVFFSSVEKAEYKDYLKKVWHKMLL